MNSPLETAPGQQRGWNLLEKIGEGDAGEVYRVESLIDHRPAILKRPSRSAFPSDVIRQATQIQREAQILSALSAIDSPARMMRAPAVFDQSRPGTEFTDRFFIVISHAPGFSLGQLARRSQLPATSSSTPGEASPSTWSVEESYFFRRLVEIDRLPPLLLLRAASGLLEYLELVHTLQVELPGGTAYGIVWNDVKVDHLYWDAAQLRFTAIDWGNGQFLESDGITKDRQHSRMGDYVQFVGEIGKFLSTLSPELYEKLSWPASIAPGNTYSGAILPLKEKIDLLLQEALAERRQVRREEADLLGLSAPSMSEYQSLSQVQDRVVALGEIPDFQEGAAFFQRTARLLVENGELSGFHELSDLAAQTPILDPAAHGLLIRISDLVEQNDVDKNALLHGLSGNWAEALWELRLAAANLPEPDWWDEISSEIRKIEIGTANLRPFVGAHRLYHALQSLKSRSREPDEIDDLMLEFSSSVLTRWQQSEPDPPHSGIAYSDVDPSLEKVAALLPEAAQPIFTALAQARAQVQLAQDAWDRQDFKAARLALRRVLLWDPDRLRLVQADRALQAAEAWLAEVRVGLAGDEPLQDFITRHELIGRDLRNQVAPASWLDALLAAFKQLRKGAEPTDVLVQVPEIRADLDWLISLEPRRPLLASPGKSLHVERKGIPPEIPLTLNGMRESPFGSKRDFRLGEALDAWAPEARGSSARLFQGTIPAKDRHKVTAAIKLMRPDQVEYALPLFREEAHILSLMRDVTGVVPLIECGFLHIENNPLPAEERGSSAAQLAGEALRYGLDSVHNFLSDLEVRTAEGWLPYLALVKYERQHNLLQQVDIGYTNGHFLPTLEGLIMAIQICDILDTAHARSIIYRDHKILHYYWLPEYNGIYMIDWNVAKRFPEGLSATEIQFDLVQFGARALHPILTGRSAQGALPLGPNRPEEIESAARSYAVSWTYDDQRLPKDIKDLLAAVLAGEYTSARKLGEEFGSIYYKLSALL